MELLSQQSGRLAGANRAHEFEPPRRATMNFFQRFTFLFSAPMFDADDLEGLRVNQIIAAIERMGFQVIKARRLEDAEIAVQTDAAIGCMVVDWGKKGLEGKAASLINLMRKRGLEMPIMILVRRKRFEDIPVEVLDFIDGYVFLAEETPEFIAKNLVSPPEAIRRNVEDAVLRRPRRLRRGRQPAVDLPRPQRRHLLFAAARSAASSSSISARRCSATTSTIRSSSSATC